MSTTKLHRTAFDEVQREAGASWTDWEGWAWAADFGDPIAEHHATRTACNVWDEAPLRKWDMRGKDALALADALFTNDMAALEVGQVKYGAMCDEQGKMIMDGTIFHVGEGHCFSITSYDSDLNWFKQVASDRGLDVALEDITREHAPPPGPGTEGAGGARPITKGADMETLRYFRFSARRYRRRHPGWLSRTGYSGELGSSSTVRPGTRATLWHAVCAPVSRNDHARSGSRRSRRCASSRACCSPTSTTSRTRPIRSRCACDNVVKLDAGRFHRT